MEGVMIIKVDWFDASRGIMRWVFTGVWTTEDYTEAVQETMRISYATPMYYLITYGAEHMPPGIVTAVMSTRRRADHPFRFSVNIAPDDYTRLLGRIIEGIPPSQYKIYFVDSEAEPLAIIEKDRAEQGAEDSPNATQP
jgi:hypothetical protein